MRTILNRIGMLLMGSLATVAGVSATTVQVDPVNANGTTIFASLNEAGEYLVNNALDIDSTPDVISIMVDSLSTGGVGDGAYRYEGTDDLTLEGDGDGNGTWCTIVVAANDDFNGTGNTDDTFLRIENDNATAWTANVVIRNLIVIPEFQSAGAVTAATAPAVHGFYSHALGTHANTAGNILVENVIVTGSLPGNVAADPFSDELANVTRFSRGIFTRNKDTNAAQADTITQFRNTTISFLDNEAVRYSGDNEITTFGPGFIVTYIQGGGAIAIISDATNADIRFAGTAVNRNLFYKIGSVQNDMVINADGPISSQISEISYTDFVSNTAMRQIRGHMPFGLLDNILAAELLSSGGGDARFDFFSADSSALTISNSTFHNTAPSGSFGRHVNVNASVTSLQMSNCIFSAASGEADATSTTTDMALAALTVPAVVDGCLFPETGPYRLRPPYDTEFPPNPPADTGYISGTAITFTGNNLNADPNYVSADLADYPLPASLAAWQTTKITLSGSSYLLPDGVSLMAAGISGAHASAVPVELSTFGLE